MRKNVLALSIAAMRGGLSMTAPMVVFATDAAVQYPRITHVAIRYAGETWRLPAPNRHHHVIRAIGGIKGPDVQGFADENGTFLNRRHAMTLAMLNGQLNRRPGGYQGPELFSEDLW